MTIDRIRKALVRADNGTNLVDIESGAEGVNVRYSLSSGYYSNEIAREIGLAFLHAAGDEPELATVDPDQAPVESDEGDAVEALPLCDACGTARAASFVVDMWQCKGCMTELSQEGATEDPEPEFVWIVFDGPPSHEAGRFVEVEDGKGASINFGEWHEQRDGYWCLRVNLPREARQIAGRRLIARLKEVRSWTKDDVSDIVRGKRIGIDEAEQIVRQECGLSQAAYRLPDDRRDADDHIDSQWIEALVDAARLS